MRFEEVGGAPAIAHAQEFVRFAPGPSIGGVKGTRLEGRRCPSERTRPGVRSLFAGPFDWWTIASRKPAATHEDFCVWVSGRMRRVLMSQRAASCPSARLTRPALESPVRVRSLGRRRHRTASPFPAALKRKEAQGAGVFLFSKPWGALSFLLGTEPQTVGEGASDRCPCRGERVGRVSRADRHEAALCTIGTLSCVLNPTTRDVFVRGGGLTTRDVPITKGPAKNEPRPCTGGGRSLLHPRSASPFPSK